MTVSLRAVTLAALFATTALPALAETPDDQLVVGFSMTNVLTLDPAAITGREPVQILANVYDGLVTLDAKDRAKVNPDLAESWEIAGDGSTILPTAKLRGPTVARIGAPLPVGEGTRPSRFVSSMESIECQDSLAIMCIM